MNAVHNIQYIIYNNDGHFETDLNVLNKRYNKIK